MQTRRSGRGDPGQLPGADPGRGPRPRASSTAPAWSVNPTPALSLQAGSRAGKSAASVENLDRQLAFTASSEASSETGTGKEQGPGVVSRGVARSLDRFPVRSRRGGPGANAAVWRCDPRGPRPGASSAAPAWSSNPPGNRCVDVGKCWYPDAVEASTRPAWSSALPASRWLSRWAIGGIVFHAARPPTAGPPAHIYQSRQETRTSRTACGLVKQLKTGQSAQMQSSVTRRAASG